MDSDDHIEQVVNVTDHGQTGDITLIGKIVYVIQNPALWQDAVWTFLTRHRAFLLVWAALQALLAWGWLSFYKLYLISPALWGLGAALLTVTAWGGYSLLRRQRSVIGTAVTLLSAAGLAGLLGWQGWRISAPPAFDPGVFGIAFAELGEGGDYTSTARAREISDQAYEYLCQVIKEDFLTGSDQKPCWAAGQTHQGRIQVQRAGIISSPQMAEAYGRKLRAKVVIWGNLLVSKQGTASVRFQMLETPDRAVSPDMPLILPVTLSTGDLFSEAMDLSSDPEKLKDTVAHESSLISATTLGLAAFATMDYPRAVTQFNTAEQVLASTANLSVSPRGEGLLHYYAARANLYMGRMSEGIDKLLQAQRISPQEPAIFLSLASAYSAQGKSVEKAAALKAAETRLQDWLSTHPEDTNALFDRGIMHMTARAYPDAVLDLQRVVALNPDFLVAYISLAQSYTGVQQLDQAEAALDQALALAEISGANPMWVYINRGVVRNKAGKIEDARRDFQAAIAAEPGNQWTYYYAAAFFDQRNETDAALFNFQKLVQIAWNKGWAYGRLADFYRRRGLLPQALDNYRRAVHDAPSDSLLRTYLAETLEASGDTAAALDAFKAAAELNEAIPYVYARYGISLFNQKDYAGAARQFERALALQPGDEISMFNLALAYEALQQIDQAVPLYQQIVKNAAQPPSSVAQKASQRLEELGVAP